MTEKERQAKAQEIFQATAQAIAQNFGVIIEPALQVEAISEAYVSSRAVFLMKPLPNWQPPTEAKEN